MRKLTDQQWQRRVERLEVLASVKEAQFEGDDADARAHRIARALVSQYDFATTYLKHWFTAGFAPMHHDLFRIAQEDQFAVIEAPRGFGKSTVFSFCDSLWRMCRAGLIDRWNGGWNRGQVGPADRRLAGELRGLGMPFTLLREHFLVLSSCTEPQAEELTGDVKLELEENALLQSDFGDLVTDRGVNYGDFEANNVRLAAVGLHQSRRGIRERQHRPDLWKVDDPDDENLTLSSEGVRDRHFKRLLGFVGYALAPHGRLMVMGNEMHSDGVVGRLYHDAEKSPEEQRFVEWKRYRFCALDEHGESIWPEWFPTAKLMTQRRMDEEIFEREMMHMPRSGAERPFTHFGSYNRADYDGKKLPTVMVGDPSMAKRANSDFQCIIVLKRDGDRLLIWRCFLTRLPPPQWRALWLRVYREEEPDIAGIEAVAFSELWILLVDEAGDAEGLFPSTRPIPQHEDKDLRIVSLVPLASRDRLLMPSDGSCAPLRRQFDLYPDGKKDGPDTVEMGVRLFRQANAWAGKVSHSASRRGSRDMRRLA